MKQTDCNHPPTKFRTVFTICSGITTGAASLGLFKNHFPFIGDISVCANLKYLELYTIFNGGLNLIWFDI